MRPLITSILLAVIVLSAACGGDSDQGDTNPTNTPAASAPTTAATTEPTTAPPVSAAELPYDIVEMWNDGQGKAIVISPDYVTDADMTALGDQLKRETAASGSAVIFVFDDPQAAALRAAVANGEASDADLELYDLHYVGQYTKNGATGFNAFVFYLDGVGGTQQQTIDY